MRSTRNKEEENHTIWLEGSPTVALFKHAWEAAGYHRWDDQRVVRACNVIRCTRENLLAYAGVYEREEVRRILKRKDEPWPVPLVLHFSRLEELAAQVAMKATKFVLPSDMMAAKIMANPIS